MIGVAIDGRLLLVVPSILDAFYLVGCANELWLFAGFDLWELR